MGKPFGKINKGGFHRWLGKAEGEPITAADIARGIAAGGHPAKMAEFARSAQEGKFGHKKAKKETREDRSKRLDKWASSKR